MSWARSLAIVAVSAASSIIVHLKLKRSSKWMMTWENVIWHVLLASMDARFVNDEQADNIEKSKL